MMEDGCDGEDGLMLEAALSEEMRVRESAGAERLVAMKSRRQEESEDKRSTWHVSVSSPSERLNDVRYTSGVTTDNRAHLVLFVFIAARRRVLSV